MLVRRAWLVWAFAVLGAVAAALFLQARRDTGLAFNPPTSGLYAALDCNTTLAGIQDACSYPTGTSSVQVAVAVTNVNMPDVRVVDWDFEVTTEQQSTFNPPNNGNNPDLDEGALGPNWACFDVRSDANPNPNIALSILSCGDQSSNGVVIAPGSSLVLGTVLYQTPGTVASGTFEATSLRLALLQGVSTIQQLHVCDSSIEENGACFPASISVTPATPTPTACPGVCPTATTTPIPTSTSTPVPTPTSTSCDGVAAPAFVSVSQGAVTDVLFDKWCTAVFALNPSQNRIEVFSLLTGSLENPIPTGIDPRAFDFSPDGETLYVSNYGSSDIRIYDVPSRAELRRVNAHPIGFCQGRPMSLAVANNGLVLFESGKDSCSAGNIMQLDPSTDVILERVDYFTTFTSPHMRMEASGDRSVIVLGDTHELIQYKATTDSFQRYVTSPNNESPLWIDLDETGESLLVNNRYNLFLFDDLLNLNATMPGQGCCPSDAGAAISSSGTAGYHTTLLGLEVLDLTAYAPLSTIPLSGAMTDATFLNGRGRVELSDDGTLAAVIRNTGLAFAELPPPPSPIPDHTPVVTATPTNTTCSAGAEEFKFFPIAGAPLDGVIVDKWCERAYASNTSKNRVEVLNLRSQTLEAPIQVGSRPRGLEFSADGNTLYVASSGGNYVSHVSLGARAETERFYLPFVFSNSSQLSLPWYLIRANNGLLMIAAQRLISYNPGLGVAVTRSDFGQFLDPHTLTGVAATANGANIAVLNGRWAWHYNATTDTVGPMTFLGGIAGRDIAANLASGGWLVTTDAFTGNETQVRGPMFEAGTSLPFGGAAIDPSANGRWAYFSGADGVEVLDLVLAAEHDTLPTGDTGGHDMDRSDDGALFVVATDNGLSIVTNTYEPDSDGDAMPDAYEQSRGCLNKQVANGGSDADGDTVANLAEFLRGIEPCLPDTDTDLCADGEELGTNESQGGDRDPLGPWDFFDVPAPATGTGSNGRPVIGPTSTRSKVINLQDVGVVLGYVGRAAGHADYIADYNLDSIADGVQMDRTPSTVLGQPWRSGPPSGAITLQDVGVALAQVGHRCDLPP